MIQGSYIFPKLKRWQRLGSVAALCALGVLSTSCQRPLVKTKKPNPISTNTTVPRPPTSPPPSSIRVENTSATSIPDLGSLRLTDGFSECRKSLETVLNKIRENTVRSGGTEGLTNGINKARTEADLKALEINQKIQELALLHAYEIVERGNLSNGAASVCDLGSRLRATGFSGPLTSGQVLALGSGGEAEILQAWLKATPSSQNILFEKHTQMGAATLPTKEGNGENVWVLILLSPTGESQPPSGDSPDNSGNPPARTPTPADPREGNGGTDRAAASLGQYDCPSGFQLQRPVSNSRGVPYCASSSEVMGAFTKPMRDLCEKWGGGSETCQTNRWSRKLYESARGDNLCPRGSSYNEKLKFCVEGSWALGPFPSALVDFCKSESQNSSECGSERLPISVLNKLL